MTQILAVHPCISDFVAASAASDNFCLLPTLDKMADDDYVITDPNDFWLKMACPANSAHPSGNPVTRWRHAEDSRRMLINCDGTLKCTGGHCHPLKNWQWKCAQHSGASGLFSAQCNI